MNNNNVYTSQTRYLNTKYYKLININKTIKWGYLSMNKCTNKRYSKLSHLMKPTKIILF